MTRTIRATADGMIYHVLNRGNARQKIFKTKRDYIEFLNILRKNIESI